MASAPLLFLAISVSFDQQQRDAGKVAIRGDLSGLTGHVGGRINEPGISQT
jgi:hypothetical protein